MIYNPIVRSEHIWSNRGSKYNSLSEVDDRL
jgi:hypothetical protein